jgi:hypothetical protein
MMTTRPVRMSIVASFAHLINLFAEAGGHVRACFNRGPLMARPNAR